MGVSRFHLVALSSRGVPLTTFCEAVAAEEDDLGAESPQYPVPPLTLRKRREAGQAGVAVQPEPEPALGRRLSRPHPVWRGKRFLLAAGNHLADTALSAQHSPDV